MDKLVMLKSSRYGLEIHLNPQAEFSKLLREMERKLKASIKFFEGAKMAVEFKDRLLSQAEEDQLLDLISKTAGMYHRPESDKRNGIQKRDRTHNDECPAKGRAVLSGNSQKKADSGIRYQCSYTWRCGVWGKSDRKGQRCDSWQTGRICSCRSLRG